MIQLVPILIDVVNFERGYGRRTYREGVPLLRFMKKDRESQDQLTKRKKVSRKGKVFPRTNP